MLTSHDFSHPGPNFSWLFSTAFGEGRRFDSLRRYTFVSHQKILWTSIFWALSEALVWIWAKTKRTPWNPNLIIWCPRLEVLKKAENARSGYKIEKCAHGPHMSPNVSRNPLKSKLKNLMPKSKGAQGAQNELKTPEQALKLKILHVVRIWAQTDHRNPWNQS